MKLVDVKHSIQLIMCAPDGTMWYFSAASGKELLAQMPKEWATYSLPVYVVSRNF